MSDDEYRDEEVFWYDEFDKLGYPTNLDVAYERAEYVPPVPLRNDSIVGRRWWAGKPRGKGNRGIF